MQKKMVFCCYNVISIVKLKITVSYSALIILKLPSWGWEEKALVSCLINSMAKTNISTACIVSLNKKMMLQFFRFCSFNFSTSHPLALL